MAKPRLPPSTALLRPDYRVIVPVGVLGLGSLALLIAQVFVAGPLLAALPVFALYVVCTAVMAGALVEPRRFRPDARPLSLEDGTLRAGTEALAERSAITQAFVIRDPSGRACVEIRGPRRILLSCESEAEAEEVVRALELDTSRRTAVYKVASQLLVSPRRRLPVLASILAGWCGSLVLALGGGAIGAGLLMSSFVLVAAIGAALLWPTQIMVGADGVVIRWLGMDRRIPLREIEHVVRSPGVLRLLLRSDEEIQLVYPGRGLTAEELAHAAAKGVTTGPAELDRAGARIEEALAAYPSPDAGAPELSLERGKRTVTEWMRHLRMLGGAAQAERGNYREAALPPERLWRIVEDPGSSSGARAGAAVALARGLDPEGKRRLRIAAEATALPGIRVLLESVAGEEAVNEAALCELLDQVDDGVEAKRGRR